MLGASVLATASALVGCAPEPVVEPEPVVLTVTDAGKRYLEAVCPLNAAWDAVDLEIDRVRIGIERGETVDLSLFREAVASVTRLSTAAEASLGDASVEWPAAAVGPVTDVRNSLDADIEQTLAVSQLSADAVATYVWKGTDEVASSAAAARASLELPDDPSIACELG